MAAGPAAGGADADASIGELVAGIQKDLTSLVRGEIELGKAELRESAARAGLGGGLIALAAFLVLLALVMASIALAYGLVALGLHPGWAFLIVTGFYLLLAGILGLFARNRFKGIRGPERAQRAAARATRALRLSSRT